MILVNKTKLLWSSGIGTPAGVPAPGFELWSLQNLHMGCSIRDRRPLHGEPPGDLRAHAHFDLQSGPPRWSQYTRLAKKKKKIV